jgi:hypothetical protein
VIRSLWDARESEPTQAKLDEGKDKRAADDRKNRQHALEKSSIADAFELVVSLISSQPQKEADSRQKTCDKSDN